MHKIRTALATACVLASSVVHGQTNRNIGAEIQALNPSAYLNFNGAGPGFKDQVSGATFAAGSTGSTLYQQNAPGGWAGNYSAQVDATAKITAPNATLGDFDWTQPFSVYTHIDSANFKRSNYMVEILAGKGQNNFNMNSSDTSVVGWCLYLQWTGNAIVPKFYVSASKPAGVSTFIQTVAPDNQFDMPNGLSYDILATYDGSGTSAGLKIYVNGVEIPEGRTNAGTFTPSIHTYNAYPLTLNGDPGSLSTAYNPSPFYFNEFAVFPYVLSAAQVYNLYPHAKSYLSILGPPPLVPMPVIFGNDGCTDPDNTWAYKVLVMLDRLHYIKLIAVVDEVQDPYSATHYRQMLDSAGLGHVPVGRGLNEAPGVTDNNYCSAAILAKYNANYASQTYPSQVSVLRAALASSPTPVTLVWGGGMSGLYDLMQSPADAVGPDGATLFASKVAAIHAQSGNGTGSATGDNLLQNPTTSQYVLAHTGAVPLYAYGGGLSTFGATGPGAPETHTGKDPFGQAIAAWTVFAAGATSRPGYDSQPVLGIMPGAATKLFGTPVRGTYSISTTGTPTISFTAGASGNHYSMTNTGSYSIPALSLIEQWLLNSLANIQPVNTPRLAY